MSAHPQHDNTVLLQMLQKGFSSADIQVSLGPVSKDRLYKCRQRLGMRAHEARRVMGEEADPPARMRRPMAGIPKRCPKCAGCLLVGGVRFSQAVKDLWSCLSCGLSSESGGYVDSIKNKWVEM